MGRADLIPLAAYHDATELSPVWVFLFIGVGLVGMSVNAYRRTRRSRSVANFAKKQGFVYSPRSPQGFLSHGFPLFLSGEGRIADNGVEGRWKDLPFKMADFHYYEGGGFRWHHFSAAVADLPAWLPETRIHRENVMSGLRDGISGDDIEFESDRFNRTYRIASLDRKFTMDLIEPRMMRWLLSCDPRFCFEVRGRAILVFAKRLNADDLLLLIGTLKEFHERIPRFVTREYVSQPSLDA